MIVIVGANAWLTTQIGPLLAKQHRLLLLGRSLPPWAKNLPDKSRVDFRRTDYHKGENSFVDLVQGEKLTIVFVGIGITPDLLANVSSAELEHFLESHLVYPFELIKGVLPQMMASKFGRFIFVGSSQGSRGIVGAAAYTTIKAAQKGLSRALATEYGRFGITSNVLEIGYLGGGLDRDLQTEVRQSFLRSSPTGKPITVPDVARAIQFILDSASVSGQVIVVDAGA